MLVAQFSLVSCSRLTSQGFSLKHHKKSLVVQYSKPKLDSIRDAKMDNFFSSDQETNCDEHVLSLYSYSSLMSSWHITLNIYDNACL